MSHASASLIDPGRHDWLSVSELLVAQKKETG